MKDNPWSKFIEVTNHGHTIHFKCDFAIHNGTLDDVIEDLIAWRNRYEKISQRYWQGIGKLIIEDTTEMQEMMERGPDE